MFREINRDEAGYIPELADNFDKRLEVLADGLEVKGFYEEARGAGIYQIFWKVRAREDVECLYLFAGRKNLCFLGGLKAGETAEGNCYTHICEIIPRYYDAVMEIEKVCFTAACESMEKLEILELRVEKVRESGKESGPERKCADGENGSCASGQKSGLSEVPVVFLAGDSTVTDQSCEIPYNPGTCYSSWGQALTFYVGQCAAVDNQAHCGLSTETFRNEGHFDIVERAIRPGDYCLFQFGHNDQKLPHLQAETGYRDNLLRFLEEIRQKGGIPVLVTPLGRNTWKEDGSYNDLLWEHTEAVKRIGRETDTPVINLHEFSVNFYLKNGKVKSRDYFHPADATHTNEYGAYLFAGVIADGLKAIDEKRFGNVRERAQSAEFVPEDSVWDRVNGGADGRNKTKEQKEQFDAAEKSVENLVAIVEKARKDAGNC